MSRLRLFYITISIFFLGHPNLQAQELSEEKQPLVDILKQLEQHFDITFNYADAMLDNILIEAPNLSAPLKQILDDIQRRVKIEFKQLSSKTFAVLISNLDSILSTQYLEEIVVNNYLTKGIALKHNGNVRIQPQEFGILPGLIEPDVLQTIQALPGIASVDERISNLNIRGGTHDQNLILWDGIKMYQSGHFFGLISAFSPYLTERVDVSKNGTSAVYGDGVSGIIDMRNPKDVSAMLTGGAGINLISADAFSRIPFNDKTELQLSARRSFTDWLNTPTYDQYFDRIFQDTDVTNQNNNTISQNERFYFYDASAKFVYDISPQDKLSLNAVTIYNNLDYDESATINDVVETLNSNLVQENLAAGAQYQRQWQSGFSTEAQLYVSRYTLDATNFDVINDQRLIQENQVIDTGLRLHINYLLEDNLNYFGGYQFTETGISNLEDVNNPEFRSYIKEVLRTHAIFNEVHFNSNSGRTNIKLGLRTNYINKFDEFFVEPRLSFNQKISNAFRLELLGEFKSQATSQIIDLQNDFLGVEQRRWVLANGESIPLIKSKQGSVGLHYNKNKLIISIEGFLKEVEGITTRSQGFQNQYQFVNAIGQYKVQGVDALINKQFSNFSTWISYSYSENNYTFESLNNGMVFPNNADIRHALNFASTYTFNDLKLAFGANWRSGKPYTQPLAQDAIQDNAITYAAPNSSRLEDYLRLDFSSTYSFKLGKHDAIAGLAIWNVLNNKNIIHRYYVIDDEDNISQIDNTSLGLTPNISFRIEF